MIRNGLTLRLFSLLFLSAAVRCQTVTTSDLYRNFNGTWVGLKQTLQNGAMVEEPVKIVISELPKKHLMRWDYIDKAGTGTGSRFVELDLSKSKMTMHFGEDPDEHLRVTGLDRFASKGLGEFSAFLTNSDSKGKKTIDRVTFHLAPNSFNYEWETTYDGQNYKTYSAFALKREVSLSAPGKSE